MLITALFADHPSAILPRRFMPHMLRVAAGEVGHPVRFVVCVESDDRLLHCGNDTLLMRQMAPFNFRSSGRLSAAAPYVRSVWRIVIGFLFFCHGAQKLLGLWGGHKMPLVTNLGVAGLLEFIGGALIVIGLFTRCTAFVLCGEMAFAYFHAHASHGPLPIVNMGELAVLYCFSFLYLFFAGPGPVSADRLIRKRD